MKRFALCKRPAGNVKRPCNVSGTLGKKSAILTARRHDVMPPTLHISACRTRVGPTSCPKTISKKSSNILKPTRSAMSRQSGSPRKRSLKDMLSIRELPDTYLQTKPNIVLGVNLQKTLLVLKITLEVLIPRQSRPDSKSFPIRNF